jgi:hypothetical protein
MLLALAPLAVGAIGWLVIPATTDEPWSEALTAAGIWVAVAVLARLWPLVGVVLLVVGAALGFPRDPGDVGGVLGGTRREELGRRSMVLALYRLVVRSSARVGLAVP